MPHETARHIHLPVSIVRMCLSLVHAAEHSKHPLITIRIALIITLFHVRRAWKISQKHETEQALNELNTNKWRHGLLYSDYLLKMKMQCSNIHIAFAEDKSKKRKRHKTKQYAKKKEEKRKTFHRLTTSMILLTVLRCDMYNSIRSVTNRRQQMRSAEQKKVVSSE